MFKFTSKFNRIVTGTSLNTNRLVKFANNLKKANENIIVHDYSVKKSDISYQLKPSKKQYQMAMLELD